MIGVTPPEFFGIQALGLYELLEFGLALQILLKLGLFFLFLFRMFLDFSRRLILHGVRVCLKAGGCPVGIERGMGHMRMPKEFQCRLIDA